MTLPIGRACAWLALLSASSGLTSCVSQAIPTHGGGKRFFYEQAVVSQAVDRAIAQIDWAKVAEQLRKDGDDPVDVYVTALGDEGGGVDAGGGSFFSLFGLGPGAVIPAATGVGGGSGSPTGSASHAFANARDIEYVRGRVIDSLMKHTVRVSANPQADSRSGAVYVLCSELGTAKSSLNLLVYQETSLAARASVQAAFVSGKKDANYLPLGRGECTAEYHTEFVCGYGPIGGGELVVTPGPLPVRIEVVNTPTAKSKQGGTP